MAIEKKPQSAPVVDDESPVPSQVPTRGQDEGGSDGTERGGSEREENDQRDRDRAGDRALDREKARGPRHDPDEPAGDDAARAAGPTDARSAASDAEAPSAASDAEAPSPASDPEAVTLDATPVVVAAEPEVGGEAAPLKSRNSTDATQGEPLPVRARLRKAELEELLAATEDPRTRSDIELALASLSQLLTGDTDHLSGPTAAQLNRWLEGVKHLGETAPVARHAS